MRTKARKGFYQDRVAVVLDVGTRKMCCLVARLTPQAPYDDAPADSRIKMLGCGFLLARGGVAGRIAVMEAAVRTIRSVGSKAERAADVRVNEVHVTASFGPLFSHGFTASVDLPSGVVMPRDMSRVMRAAREYAARGGKSVLHVAPYGYTLGYESGITDPLGMIGDALKVDVHAVAVEALPLRNLKHCIERSHLAVAGVSAAAFASGKAVVTASEAMTGVTCLDMGAGSTGISVFSGGNFVYCDSVDLGGNHITNDIAEAFSLPLAEAERLKTLHTSVFAEMAAHSEPVHANDDDYAGPHAGSMAKAELSQVARIRLEEIFVTVRERLRSSGLAALSGQRLVLTGGGSELIGASELAAQVFGKQPRLGRLPAIEGLPQQDSGAPLAAALGSLMHLNQDTDGAGVSITPEIVAASQGYLARVGQWLRESF